MASTPEAKVKAAVVKLLKAHDIYYFFPATHGYARKVSLNMKDSKRFQEMNMTQNTPMIQSDFRIGYWMNMKGFAFFDMHRQFTARQEWWQLSNNANPEPQKLRKL